MTLRPKMPVEAARRLAEEMNDTMRDQCDWIGLNEHGLGELTALIAPQTSKSAVIHVANAYLGNWQRSMVGPMKRAGLFRI
jgi:hypothetical protein